MSSRTISKCRTCLEAVGKYQLSEYIEEENNILEMLNEVVPQIHIKEENQFSAYICQTCLEKLLTGYKFQRLCIETHKQLEKMQCDSSPNQSQIPDPLMEEEQSLDIKDELIANESSNDCEVNTCNVEVIYKSDADSEVASGGDTDSSNEKLSVLKERKLGKCLKTKKVTSKQNSKDIYPCQICGKQYHCFSRLKVHIALHEAKKIGIAQEKGSKKPQKTSENQEDQQVIPKILENPAEDNNKSLDIGEQKMLSPETLKVADNNEPLDKDEDQNKMPNNNDSKYTCDNCDMVFDRPFRLKRHQRQHSSDKHPYGCTLCKRDFFSAKPLIKHIRKEHPEAEKFNCDQCEETFILHNHLIKHLKKRHKSGRILFCDICDKDFKYKSSLEKHMRSHNGERPYLCAQCGKTFRSSSNLSEHVTRHSGLPTFACPECPRRFKCGSDLRKHTATHTNLKPHVCDICGFRFTRAYSLLEHKRLHTGERPFKCDQCDKRFAIVYHLKRHMRTHTGEKPYRCKYCERAYAVGGDLTKHLRIHLGEKTYLCTECPMAFKYNSELRKHLIEHYKMSQNELNNGKGKGHELKEDNKEKQQDEIIKNTKKFKKNNRLCRMSEELMTSCRTCMDEQSRYYQIYDYVDENYTIVEMLDAIVPQINVKEEDGVEFSSLICESCVDKLVTSFTFQLLAIDSDKRLRQIIESPVEPVEEFVVQQVDDLKDGIEDEANELKIELEESQIKEDETLTNDNSNIYSSNDDVSEQEERQDINNIPFKIIKINTRKRFTCTDCGNIYDRVGRIEQHLYKRHGFNPSDIKDFIKQAESLEEEAQKNDWDAYLSDKIQITETADDSIQTDGKKQPVNRQYSCKACGKTFNCLSRLKRHVPVHSMDKPYTCEICLRGCSTVNAFKRHQLLHTMDNVEKDGQKETANSFQCPYCPKSFATKNSLSAHRISHSHINASYPCDFCERRYMTMRTLGEHIIRSHPDTTYRCDQCGKKFAQKEQLQKHMYSHREIQLSCDICERSFTSEFAVKEHMYIHTGENPYLCPTCGKSFKYSSSLRKHMERHTDEKKFQCPQCPRTFKCAVDVKRHIKTHLGLRPYKCNICGFRCTRSSHLKRHKELHEKKSFHKCIDCNHMFPSLQSLRRHICSITTDEENTMHIE
uniref:Uncharacterized protein n=2 Tax=Stomoxys calcitrans TaxID=35570 RepID=A0A1I8PF46_STOCA